VHEQSTDSLLTIIAGEEDAVQQLQVIHAQPSMLGEGPCWDADNRQLYWVDIESGHIHRLDVDTGQVATADFGQKVGAVALRQSGGLIVAAQHGIYLFDMETREQVRIANPEADLPNNRFNDGKCDAKGRFWAGTMSMDGEPGKGALYCIEPDHTVRKMVESVNLSNGLAWSPDNTVLYYIDSPTFRITAYEFHLETGELGASGVVAHIPENLGTPDGMTIDAEGKLWVAHWGGSRITRWDPQTGRQIGEIPMPVSKPTCCIFGGDALDQLYITSARIGSSDEELAAQPLNGAVFRAQPDASGLPAHKFGG
jgi:sugar lactone lactonase YvrE